MRSTKELQTVQCGEVVENNSFCRLCQFSTEKSDVGFLNFLNFEAGSTAKILTE